MPTIATRPATRIAHCDLCGKRMETTTFDRDPRCRRCRKDQPRITPRTRDNRPWRDLICPHCGTTFTTKSHDKVYCTKTCSRRAAEKLPTCPDCGTQLKDRRATYCQLHAARRRTGWNGSAELELYLGPKSPRVKPRRDVPHFPTFHAGHCAACRSPFVTLSWSQVTCSTSCSELWEKHTRRSARYRRRQLERSAISEYINPTQVFEADNWTCYLCHQPFDMEADGSYLKSPTLDHVVPLSKGGTHTYSNLRAACLHCNSSKGDRDLDEYLLAQPHAPYSAL